MAAPGQELVTTTVCSPRHGGDPDATSIAGGVAAPEKRLLVFSPAALIAVAIPSYPLEIKLATVGFYVALVLVIQLVTLLIVMRNQRDQDERERTEDLAADRSSGDGATPDSRKARRKRINRERWQSGQ